MSYCIQENIKRDSSKTWVNKDEVEKYETKKCSNLLAKNDPRIRDMKTTEFAISARYTIILLWFVDQEN